MIPPSPIPPVAPNPPSIYYPGGGFPSLLAALQSFNQPMNVSREFGSSNLALLQGFSLSSLSPQQQHQLFQIGGGAGRDKDANTSTATFGGEHNKRPMNCIVSNHQLFLQHSGMNIFIPKRIRVVDTIFHPITNVVATNCFSNCTPGRCANVFSPKKPVADIETSSSDFLHLFLIKLLLFGSCN
uniref:Uncharacterized protein n=1 Tax=Nelumbo nucifera TaxID=4432 RepID=A0A822YAA8_NELNU|nr:TPA_asm: hypothetical protein HUJ06_009875 [Nelumbo nucifera]